MSGGGDSSAGAGRPSGAGQAAGTDIAKEYVAPQALKSRPKGQVHGAKVQIKKGGDPRRKPTALSKAKAAKLGTQPALKTPPEVAQYAANNALPFQPAGASPSAHGAADKKVDAAAKAVTAAVTALPSGPKSPPLKLLTIGELRPLPAPLAGAAASETAADAPDAPDAAVPDAAVPDAAVPDAAVPDAAVLPVPVPVAAPILSATPPPVVVDTDAEDDSAEVAAAGVVPRTACGRRRPSAGDDEQPMVERAQCRCGRLALRGHVVAGYRGRTRTGYACFGARGQVTYRRYHRACRGSTRACRLGGVLRLVERWPRWWPGRCQGWHRANRLRRSAVAHCQSDRQAHGQAGGEACTCAPPASHSRHGSCPCRPRPRPRPRPKPVDIYDD